MLKSEAILLQRFLKNKDSQAFSQIVKRYEGLVYSASLRILKNQAKAADATQDTFLQLLRHANKITGSLAGWLHRVATRKAVDIVRKDSRTNKSQTEYAANKLLKTDKWAEISPYVDAALNELDEPLREILIQRFFEGRTTTDIAKEVNISQSTASRQIEAGIEELRNKLRKRGIIAGGLLVSLLSKNAAAVVPVVVSTELAKIALVATTSAATTTTITSAAASGIAAKALIAATASVKAKIITLVLAAILGVGSVATYNQVVKPKDAAFNKSDDTAFKKILANGVTVELLGLSGHPSEDMQWWKPDGSWMDDVPYDYHSSKIDPNKIKAGDITREIAIKIESKNLSDISWTRKFPFARSTYSGNVEINGEQIFDVKATCPANLKKWIWV